MLQRGGDKELNLIKFLLKKGQNKIKMDQFWKQQVG
jgi:hypothetical protein